MAYDLVLLDAMTLRDGGTTFVVVEEHTHGQVTYTFDYSLPWDGRLRHITKNVQGASQEIELDEQQEHVACELIKSLLEAEFGETPVLNFMREGEDNPGKGKWFYAFNFVRLAVKERKLNV